MVLADQIVQVGHACLEAGWQFALPAAPCHLVVLGVVSEGHLHTVVGDAALTGVRCAVFHEPDDELGATAACSEPIAGAARRVFRRLPLWSAPTALVRARGPPVPRATDFFRTFWDRNFNVCALFSVRR
jgi:hypothetical protein